MSEGRYRIQGRVVDGQTDQGLGGIRVEAWDKDLLFDDLVGSAISDAEGRFEITFSEAYFNECFLDRRPDLFFKLFQGERLLHSTEDSVLWNVALPGVQVTIHLQSPQRPMPKVYDSRNESTRIDRFDELNHISLAAIKTFCRRLGAPHLLDEVILPVLQDGEAQIFATVRDRPWPPWGVGSRHISALCDVQAIADESYAISPIYVTDEDALNVGLISALYKEVLESIATSPHSEVNYLVAEGSILVDHVLQATGFKKYEDVFLTERSRYFTYRIPTHELLARLGLDRVDTPDLLAHDVSTELIAKNALFHQTIFLGSRAEWLGSSLLAEIIRLARGGHSSKPGGVPSGTGRWGYEERLDPRIFVTLENFLGNQRQRLLEAVITQETNFKAATILDPNSEQPVVNERLRRAKTLDQLGDLEPEFSNRLREVLAPVLKRLEISEFPLGRIEIQVTASGDGDYFRMHRDCGNDSTRALSFVYFFHQEPRRFSGGELRIFKAKKVGDNFVPTDLSQTLSPRQDTIVFFPSQNEHEILPVRVPSRLFADSRFTVNGWIHRQ
jgi:Rps23 Pro-64 3,4-dihydroxylase Tpa1-like proline 4-hydroxylase